MLLAIAPTIRADRAGRSNIAVARQPGRKGRGDHHDAEDVPVVLHEHPDIPAGRCEPDHTDDKDGPDGVTAGSYAELVTKYPRAGGAAVFAERAFKRPTISFLVGFRMLAAGVTSAAGLALAFAGDYLRTFVDVPAVPAALVFLLLVTCLNARGISESVKSNTVIGALVTAGAVYMLIGLASAIALPPAELSTSSGPLLSVVGASGVGIPDTVFSLIALVAAANGALLTMIMASRLTFGMAEHRLLPGALGAVLPNRGTPWEAIVATTVVAMLLTSVSALRCLIGVTWGYRDSSRRRRR